MLSNPLYNTLFQFFLIFSNALIVIPLLLIGYFAIDKKIFFQTICLLLIGILFVWALKVTFQVPLSPALHKEGFAFPSGHMLSSFVLYGWLFKSTQKKSIKIGIVIVLIGIATALIYFGYHTIFDISGALFFGVLLMMVYQWLIYKKLKNIPFKSILALFGTVLVGYICLKYGMKSHAWQAYGGLLGFMVFDSIFNRYHSVSKLNH